jgi:hypothetical protein
MVATDPKNPTWLTNALMRGSLAATAVTKPLEKLVPHTNAKHECKTWWKTLSQHEEEA